MNYFLIVKLIIISAIILLILQKDKTFPATPISLKLLYKKSFNVILKSKPSKTNSANVCN